MSRGPLGPVQLIAPGLMGLLQLKQTGRLPDELLDQYRGVIELRDWLFQARKLDELALFGSVPLAVGCNAVGSFPFVPAVVVPQGQVWYVEQACLVVPTNAAADTFRCDLQVLSPSLGSFMQVTPDFLDSVTARQRIALVAAQRSFWMTPGESMRAHFMDIVTAGITASVRLRVTPMPI